MIILNVLLILLISLTQTHPCTLPDLQNTQGECVHIRQCRWQLGRYRVGSSVTRCLEKGHVCCPKYQSVSEKMCSQWREMLYAPPSFTLDRYKEPVCAVGVVQPFIVGGRDAELHEYPHSVALGYGPDQNRLRFQCGATLISDRFLISAAHCVTNQRAGKPTYAVIGDTILDPSKDPQRTSSAYRQVVKISGHYVHPDYRPPLIYNDIALLSLSTPLELSRYVLPACIGTPLTSPVTTRQILVEASGWGITDASTQLTSNKLQAINITTVDTSTCNSIYEHEPDRAFRYPNGVVKMQMCATGDEKDTCRGDSGGGLYIRESKCLFHVVGVTSIGSKICGLGSPAIYTTVASYQDWIESIVWGNSNGRN